MRSKAYKTAVQIPALCRQLWDGCTQYFVSIKKWSPQFRPHLYATASKPHQQTNAWAFSQRIWVKTVQYCIILRAVKEENTFTFDDRYK